MRYSDLAINLAGQKYALVFTAPGLRPVVCTPFDVAKGAASQLVVNRHPGDSRVMHLLSVQP